MLRYIHQEYVLYRGIVDGVLRYECGETSYDADYGHDLCSLRSPD
jgi:hypothetical protein